MDIIGAIVITWFVVMCIVWMAVHCAKIASRNG